MELVMGSWALPLCFLLPALSIFLLYVSPFLSSAFSFTKSVQVKRVVAQYLSPGLTLSPGRRAGLERAMHKV